MRATPANPPARTVFLELLRIIACFFVIVNHTCTDLFLYDYTGDFSWFLSAGWFFLSKTAVPVFFMISGYLLLGKSDSWRSAFRRVFRMLVVLLGCALVYGIYNGVTAADVHSPVQILKTIAEEIIKVYMRPPSNAMWYLYAYLGILLLLPFLQKLSAALDKTSYHILFLLTGIFICTAPILEHFSPYLTICHHFTLPLLGGYLPFLFLGQYFARFGVPKSRKGFVLAALVLIAAVVFNVVVTYLEGAMDSGSTRLFFENVILLPVVLESVSLFYMASFFSPAQKLAYPVTFLGGCTFGIYLVSDLVIALSSPVYRAAYAAPFPFVAVIVYEAGVFLCGLVIAMVLRRLPGIRKYV